jgi:hypothetical protein
LLRTHFDHDPAGTVPYAAIQIDTDVLLYVNTALLQQVDAEFHQFLSDQVLRALDSPPAGAKIISLCGARIERDQRHEASVGLPETASPI